MKYKKFTTKNQISRGRSANRKAPYAALRIIKKWAKSNTVAIAFVSVFVVVYIVSQCTENAFLYFGATGINTLNGEYYRWLTCLFLHYNLRHLLANSAALLVVAGFLYSRKAAPQPFWSTRSVLPQGSLSVFSWYQPVPISEKVYGRRHNPLPAYPPHPAPPPDSRRRFF